MSDSKEVERFKELLAKAISIPRKEMQRRVEASKDEPMATRKKFSYRPSKDVSRH